MTILAWSDNWSSGDKDVLKVKKTVLCSGMLLPLGVGPVFPGGEGGSFLSKSRSQVLCHTQPDSG